MGRNSVRLKIDSDALRLIVGDRATWSDIAEKYGVSRQAVSGWLAEGLIPPRALAEMARDLDLSPKQLDEILAPQQEKIRERKKWKITITVEGPGLNAQPAAEEGK
jgi:hypothetical protein